MGDTFIDFWEEEIPATIGEGETRLSYEGKDNSKWSGNYYSYERRVRTEGVAPGHWSEERHTIILRSYSPREKDLAATITLKKPGFDINISSFSGDRDPNNPEIWLPKVRFDNIKDCLQVAYKRYLELLPIFDALQAGPGWEGND